MTDSYTSICISVLGNLVAVIDAYLRRVSSIADSCEQQSTAGHICLTLDGRMPGPGLAEGFQERNYIADKNAYKVNYLINGLNTRSTSCRS